ncbi:hypothetical protein Tcan_11701 [Toxocara canis]|uniref:Uncharacterized protein n=1 Tax=Toxocara canis TaxID=6265 RepID=A0A0B2V239_TOXCA|nr:hypothetical protein Tcan_11701 [Toxocara canis]
MAMSQQVGKAIATEHVKDEKDIPDYEFPDSVAVNVLAPDAGQQQGLGRYAIGYAALAVAFFVRDWFRLHGQKLSRLLKPLINVSQLMVTWNFFPWFDIFASEKETIAGKYLFNADGPVLNEDNPRTPNKRNFFPWFDIFASEKETIAGKYLFNADGPVLNEDNPRTPNKSPPKSPPKDAAAQLISSTPEKQ